MKKHDSRLSFFLIMLLFAAEILPIYATWCLCVIVAFAFLTQDRFKIKRFSVPNSKIIYIFIMWGFLVGFINYFSGKVSLWPVMRDIIIVSILPLYWYIFNNLEKKFNFDEIIVFNSIYLYCGIISMYSIMAKLYALIYSNSFSIFRSSGNIGEITLSIGCYMIFFQPPVFKENGVKKHVNLLIQFSILLALIISLSRSAYLLLLCMFVVSIWTYFKTTIKVMIVLLISIIIARLLVPNYFEIFLRKIMNSFSELSHHYTYWTNSMIVTNWRGYEVYCTLEDFKKSNIIQQLFGKGFGSSIDVYGYSYLVTSESNIPFLHNGYYTTLFKFGIVGVALMIVYYLSYLYRSVIINRNYNRKMAIGLTLCIFVSTALTSGMIWRGIEMPVFAILSCLFNIDGIEKKMLKKSNIRQKEEI